MSDGNSIKTLIENRNKAAAYLEVLKGIYTKDSAKTYKKANFSVKVADGVSMNVYQLNMRKLKKSLEQTAEEIAQTEKEVKDLDRQIEWMDRENLKNVLPPRFVKINDSKDFGALDFDPFELLK